MRPILIILFTVAFRDKLRKAKVYLLESNMLPRYLAKALFFVRVTINVQ